MSWTTRVSINASQILNTYDSVAWVAGTTYSATLSLGGGCSGGIHSIDLVALVGIGATLLQDAGNAHSGSFATWTAPFSNPNAAGSCLVLDIAFTAGSYTAGPVSVTDSNGNAWTMVVGSDEADFQPQFLQTWKATNCAPGANTVTITMGGSLPFTAIAAAVHEYGNCPGSALASNYATGPLFGTGSPVEASVTPAAQGLLHLAVQGDAACSGSSLVGGGIQPAWLIIVEPGLGPTDRSNYLYKSTGAHHSWTQQIRQRGQATVDLVVPSGDTYSPTRATQLFLHDQTAAGYTRTFAGIIQDVEDKWLDNAGERRLSVTAMSMESVFDTVYADPVQYVDQTCGFILTDLFNRFEAGCPVTLGVVSAGESIPLFNVKKGDRLSDLFTQLATTSLFTWGVDPVSLSLNFRNPSSDAAPFVLASDDILWETPNWKIRGADFRNRQGARVGFNAFPHSMEFFPVVSSGQQSFVLRNPAQQVVKCYVTLSTCNTAAGSFSGVPSPGDTVTVGPNAAAWVANHIYALGGQVVSGGFVQEVTTAGTSGSTLPPFGTVTGDTTADFTVVWTCRGASGFSTGTYTYTWVASLDNTQFGQVLIGATVADCAQNLYDAINAAPAKRRLTISLPTWENSQCNAVSITGTGFTLQQKAAGSGWVAAISATGTAFSWSSGTTTGGTSPQGSVGPGLGATADIGVFATGTSSSADSLVYTEGSPDVFLTTPRPTVPVGLNIEYTRVDGDVVEVEDSALIASTAVLTGGTGVYAQFTDQGSTGLISTSAPAALQLIQQALAAFKVPPANFSFDTLRPGLRAGMTLTAAILKPAGASALLDGAWVIESIDASLMEPAKVPYLTPELGHYRYTVSCVDVNQIGSWLDFWNGNGGGGGGGSSLVATSGGALTPSSTAFPQDFGNQTVSGRTFAAGNGFSFELASFLNCTAAGCAFTGRFSGAIFQNATLDGSTFSGEFENCDFTAASFNGCTFTGRFTNCNFFAASGTGVTASGCDFSGSNFHDATLHGDLHLSIFTGCDLLNFDMDTSNAKGTQWVGSSFRNSTLHNVDFSASGSTASIFTGCAFVDNLLDGSTFAGAILQGASFFQCGGAGTPPVFDGANVTGVRFNDFVAGAGYQTVKPVTVSYSVRQWDANKVISTSGSGVTVTLPSPVSDTWQCVVQNTDPSNAVTVDPGAATINGAAGAVTIAPGAALQIFCDGTNYFAF